MKPGDMVRVKNTMEGDPSNMTRLYRERVPLLFIDMCDEPSMCAFVLDATSSQFPRLQIDSCRLEVISGNW